MRIIAVLEEPELGWLRIGLGGMGLKHASIAVHGSDLEALQATYVEGRPDLFILDLDLPGVIGLATLRAMRQQKELESLPVILVSNEDLVLGQRAILRTHNLVKPAHPDCWREAIRAVLSVPQPRSEVPPEPAVPEEPREKRARAERKSERKAFETPCLVGVAGSKTKGVLRDISMTGAKIAFQLELKERSMVILILGVPGTVPLKIIQIKANVVRKTADGFGLAFREMDPDTRSFVLAVTKQ